MLRRVLYLAALRSTHTEGSAFGAYYHHLVERGRKYGSALMAVIRKMLAVAVHLLKHQEDYDPSKVCAGTHGLLRGAQPNSGLWKGDVVCLQA